MRKKKKNHTWTLMLAIDRAMSDSDNRSHMDTFEVNHDHSGPELYQFEPLRTVVVCDETSILKHHRPPSQPMAKFKP